MTMTMATSSCFFTVELMPMPSTISRPSTRQIAEKNPFLSLSRGSTASVPCIRGRALPAAHSSLACTLSDPRESFRLSARFSNRIGNQLSSSFRRSDLQGNGRLPRVQAALTPQEYDEREEARWQREEARWLREEARWQKKEAEMEAEIAELEGEVLRLKRAIAEIYGGAPPGADLASLLDRLRAWEAASRSSTPPLDAEIFYKSLTPGGAADLLKQVPDADVIAAVASRKLSQPRETAAPSPAAASPAPTAPPHPTPPPVSSAPSAKAPSAPPTTSPPASPAKRRTLKKGMEGDDVALLQDALGNLGFHCGDEDMEGAFFDLGTASAVKTWQATIGVKEDGIVTESLQVILFGEATSIANEAAPSSAVSPPATAEVATSKPSIFAPAAPTWQKPEIERYARSDVEANSGSSRRRVYLLGENRWEDPDSLKVSTNSQGVKTMGAPRAAHLGGPKCYACRGEGHTVCMECEGTGDLNVEDQFLDWAGEEAKCIYCSGNGAIVCDICFGNGHVEK